MDAASSGSVLPWLWRQSPPRQRLPNWCSTSGLADRTPRPGISSVGQSDPNQPRSNHVAAFRLVDDGLNDLFGIVLHQLLGHNGGAVTSVLWHAGRVARSARLERCTWCAPLLLWGSFGLHSSGFRLHPVCVVRYSRHHGRMKYGWVFPQRFGLVQADLSEPTMWQDVSGSHRTCRTRSRCLPRLWHIRQTRRPQTGHL
jgi:hypothetical protein